MSDWQVPAGVARRSVWLTGGLALAAPGVIEQALAAEKAQIMVGRAYGMDYLATLFVKDRKLAKEHAAHDLAGG